MPSATIDNLSYKQLREIATAEHIPVPPKADEKLLSQLITAYLQDDQIKNWVRGYFELDSQKNAAPLAKPKNKLSLSPKTEKNTNAVSREKMIVDSVNLILAKLFLKKLARASERPSSRNEIC